MKKEDFEKFIKDYLQRFRKTYRVKDINKKELKRSVFDNKNLTYEQKDTFWKMVVER